MKKTNTLWILILLVMFPQFVETIYSPALPLIARKFGVSEETATLTISFYFIAFAAGVIFWGIQCDRIGRKNLCYPDYLPIVPELLLPLLPEILKYCFWRGLFLPLVSQLAQLLPRQYCVIFMIKKIGKAFSFVGIGLSISPVIGMLTGAVISSHLGYMGVFGLLFILAIILIFWHKETLKRQLSQTNI